MKSRSSFSFSVLIVKRSSVIVIYLVFAKITRAIFAAMQASDDLQTRWRALETRLAKQFGKIPDLEAVLFLIGIQEFGQIKEKFTKEQKQDLMHVAVCKLLSQSGYYELEKIDDEGWPHFRQLKPMPVMSMMEQENFLKDHILLYFENHEF